MRKRKQRPWALAAFGVSAIIFGLLWNLRPLAVDIARQSLFDCLLIILMIACGLMAFAIGVMVAVQKIVVV